jgi:hypothetical protein
MALLAMRMPPPGISLLVFGAVGVGSVPCEFVAAHHFLKKYIRQ